MKLELESNIKKSLNPLDLGFVKNCWNLTTFGLNLHHIPNCYYYYKVIVIESRWQNITYSWTISCVGLKN